MIAIAFWPEKKKPTHIPQHRSFANVWKDKQNKNKQNLKVK